MPTVKIYFLDADMLSDDAIFGKYYDRLSDARREKTDRMRFRRDKNLSLGAGILLDIGFREYGYRERDMKYGSFMNGKPYSLLLPSVKFNISHSGHYVIAAFADTDVGCDIERIADGGFAIAKRFFHEDEIGFLSSIEDEGERNDAFYRLWTLKESFMKVTGLGMRLPFDEFAIRIGGEEITVNHKSNGEEYGFAELDIDAGYKCSVCTKGRPGTVELCRVMPEHGDPVK